MTDEQETILEIAATLNDTDLAPSKPVGKGIPISHP